MTAAALVAEYADQDTLITAAGRAREAGYRRIEAYSPFPVPGLAQVMGFAENRVPWAAAVAFAVGFVGMFGLQWWTNAVHYPLNVGGRPLFAWPAFLYPAFLVACVAAGLAAMVAMLLLNRLPHHGHRSLEVARLGRASQDRFFLWIDADDPRFRLEETRAFLVDSGALFIHEVPP